MKLAVCIPSRGLINSRTIASVILAVRYYWKGDYAFFFTHNQPIPDCFNTLVKDALEWGADRLWFVEEDMWIKTSHLRELLDEQTDIATADYPVARNKHTVVRENGKVMFCGTGCLLVKREVFDQLGYPYFRSHITYTLPDYTPVENTSIGYGRQDIDFGVRVRALGYEIKVITSPAGQLKLKQLGQERTNDGCHAFEEWAFEDTTD